jgi:hypothetical protein
MTDHPLRFPLRLSRKGTTRVVLVVGPLAVKFARGERGRRCNRFEAACISTSMRVVGPCCVLSCGVRRVVAVLLMRAAQPLTEAEAAMLRAKRGFPDWDYAGPNDKDSPFEPKASDCGWLNCRLVALDYSTPEL